MSYSHSIFAECHPFVSPDNFYQGCVFDSCHVSNPAVECTSLQTYAAACAQAGVCIHWRNHTTLCGKLPFIVFFYNAGVSPGGGGIIPFVQSSKLGTNCCRFIIPYLEDHMKNHSSLLTASDCPSDKVYKPCGPVEQPTCDDE